MASHSQQGTSSDVARADNGSNGAAAGHGDNEEEHHGQQQQQQGVAVGASDTAKQPQTQAAAATAADLDDDIPRSEGVSSRESTSWWIGQLLFTWVTPLLSLGSKSELRVKNLWPMVSGPSESHTPQTCRARSVWCH